MFRGVSCLIRSGVTSGWRFLSSALCTGTLSQRSISGSTQVPFQRRPDQADLRGQVPVFHLVGAHGAAEDHQSAVTVELRPGIGMPAEVHVADPEARFLEQGIQ